MKPKYIKFARILPAAVFISMSMPSTTQASIFPVDPAGNAQPTAANNGATTIRANGGTSVNPLVNIISGVIMTGDIVVPETEVLEITAANYSVTNAGSLSGTNHHGINSTQAFVLDNYGTIAGGTSAGRHGVLTTNADIINYSSGKITGTGDAIHFTTNGGIVTNYGMITGGTGAGIDAGFLAVINNHGTIETDGGEFAITLAGDGEINLDYGSTIMGSIEGGGSTTLNFMDGQIDFNEDPNIIYGDVYGMESINKDGPGFAFIGETGDEYWTEAESLSVNSGGLFINGDVFASEGNTQITVDGFEAEMLDADDNPIAELGGFSSELGWDADIKLQNGGGIGAGSTPIDLAWYLEDTVGTLTINGDVTHALDSESYIRVNIVPQTDSDPGFSNDLIVNNGVYDIGNADIRITPTNDFEVLRNGTYTIIDSNNPIIGADVWNGWIGVQFSEQGSVYYDTVLTNYFTTIGTEDPLFDGIFNLGDTNVVLDIEHDYAGLPGLTDNQSALGSAIDASVNSDNPEVQQFIAYLDYSNLETVQDTLATLDPGATFGVVSSVVNSNYRLHRLTQQHLAGVRNSETIIETGSTTTDAKGAIVSVPTTTRSAGTGSFWGTLSYDWQDYDGNGDYPDYDGETGAITAGFDWRMSPQFVLGLVLDGSSGDFNSDAFDSDVDSLRAAIYGTWGSSTGFYSDFLLGYGAHDFDSNRRLGGMLAGEDIRNDTEASSLQAMWTVGYTIGDANLKHGPFAGLEYQNVDVDGFSESGPLFDMEVDGYDVDSFRGLIGYRVDANYGTFRPYATVAYAHEFEDGDNRTTASFAGNEFDIYGAEQSSAIIITAGTGIALSSNLMIDVGYRGEIATDDGMSSHGGSIGLNYSF